MLVYIIRDPKGPSGGAFIAFIAFAYAWALLLLLSTIHVILWIRATRPGWMLACVSIPALWVAVGLLWKFLFMASDPNYPARLVPGRILFGALSVGLYFVNLLMLSRVRGPG